MFLGGIKMAIINVSSGSELNNIFGNGGNGLNIRVKTSINDANYNRLKKEVSRLASMANKRVKRLEKNGLESTSAYKTYIAQGGQPFSVKGKDYNDLQKELARIRQFTENTSSTIKGVKTILNNIQKNTGLTWKSKKASEMYEEASKYFELASKIEQYLRMTEDAGSFLGYMQIWEAINQYTKEANTDIDEITTNMDDVIQKIANLITYEDVFGAVSELNGQFISI